MEPMADYLYPLIPGSGISKSKKPTGGEHKNGYLVDVSVKDYFTDAKKANFKDTAKLYYPSNCIGENKKCNLMVLFHGCSGNSDTMSNLGRGYTDWA